MDLAGLFPVKTRDVSKVAVLPLRQASSDVTIELNIHADDGLTGIPRETLNLVVLEGLRQLGFTNVDVKIGGNAEHGDTGDSGVLRAGQ